MHFIKWVSIAFRHTKMYLDKQLAPLGVNSSQHMYIIRINEEPGVTQDQFVNGFYIHPSNVTRSLMALEKGGFVRREANEGDRRTFRLYPTEKAKNICRQIKTIGDAWQEAVLADFSPEDRQKFLDMLRQAGEKSVQLLNSKPDETN